MRHTREKKKLCTTINSKINDKRLPVHNEGVLCVHLGASCVRSEQEEWASSCQRSLATRRCAFLCWDWMRPARPVSFSRTFHTILTTLYIYMLHVQNDSEMITARDETLNTYLSAYMHPCYSLQSCLYAKGWFFFIRLRIFLG